MNCVRSCACSPRASASWARTRTATASPSPSARSSRCRSILRWSGSRSAGRTCAARAAAQCRRLRRLAPARRPGRGVARALRARRRRRSRCGTAWRPGTASPGRRCWRTRSDRSSAALPANTQPATTRSSSERSSRSRAASTGRALVYREHRLPRRLMTLCREHRGVVLRHGRRAHRLRAPLGRDPRATRARARRPLARTRAARHDGNELARVVPVHARRDRPRRVARGDQRGGRAAAPRAVPGVAAPHARRGRGGRATGRRDGRSASRRPRTAR